MDGLQRRLKYAQWTAEPPHLRPPHNANNSRAAVPRFPTTVATPGAFVAEDYGRALPSRSKLFPASSQELSRLEHSDYCDRVHPTQNLSRKQKLQRGVLEPTIGCHSHGSQLFPFLTRSCSSPAVNGKGHSGALCPDVEQGSLPPVTQSKVNILSGNMTSSLFGGHAAPLPLFDSRAAAATAASCCTHAATADAASPRRWAGKALVGSSSCRESVRAENTHSINGPFFQRPKGKPQKNGKQASLDSRQTYENSTGEYESAAEAAQENEKLGQTKAVGCTASPRTIEAYAKSPRLCHPSGNPKSLSGYTDARSAATIRESSANSSSSSCSAPDMKMEKQHLILAKPPAKVPDTTEKPVRTNNAHLASAHCDAPQRILKSLIHLRASVIVAVDDNLERFEGMLEPIVKLLVDKTVEQAIEEAKQEQQLLTLHKRRQELLKNQQQQLLELEQREARRHFQAQQAIQNQLAAREHETQLWRHLWVAHIGTTLLDEDSLEKIVEQLDEESSFLSSVDTLSGEFLAEVAKAATGELKKRKDIGEELAKLWFNAEKVQTASRRQQELLIWGQHLRMREKIKRRRELRRGVVHIFVTPADGRIRQLSLKAEAERLTEAFKEQQRQRLSPKKYKITSEREKASSDDADGQDNTSTSSNPSGSSAVICIGPFKLLRKQDSATGQKKFISMEKLQQEVQKRMCDCFNDMAAIIRCSQIIFEAKGIKISEVDNLLKYEYGDLRVRLDRKITFANPTDESEGEMETEESGEFD
ncbi:LOW QUALITY PROTEIN: uncharacterized protein EMH_0053790 [Eimeria mitis]|uniref:Uncharacterized protein n=1 Tax=Eimeria mitis TaxID=44415 RepID=U6KB31_9EIME|nr:LOW QUALITY PROTEIN: uncharacterized protein EMH_0053790 [Eimeria mitis]CDJ33412.1 hypothetical protein, conserved [Eimeria mitis]